MASSPTIKTTRNASSRATGSAGNGNVTGGDPTNSDATVSVRDLSSSSPVNLHQGDTIRLPDDGSIRLPQTPQSGDSLYQVIALDAGHDRCWIRSWPLTRHGSPVFEISLQQAQRHGAHRPVLQRQSP